VILSEIEFVIPKGVKFNEINTGEFLNPFDNEVLGFLDSLSKELLKLKEYNELVALGFWLRKSNIEKMKKEFFKKYENNIVLPRGVTFHIAPSNVDTIFVYSFVLSMLVGNVNILRIGQKTNEQILTLIKKIEEVLNKYPKLKNKLYIARYGYEEEINEFFSSICDLRIIWGGDETVNTIRKIPLKPTALELTFADKFSFALLDLNSIELNEQFFEKLYRDSFTFLQQACSSVRAICFLPVDNDKKKEFWQKFEEFIQRKNPRLEDKEGITRFNAVVSMAIEEKIKVYHSKFLYVVKVGSLDVIDRVKHPGLGVFYDIDIDSIEELLKFSTKKEQTLSLAGIKKEELVKAIKNVKPKGFDRYVNVGNAMNFSEVWDGFDLLSSLSRIIDVDI